MEYDNSSNHLKNINDIWDEFNLMVNCGDDDNNINIISIHNEEEEPIQPAGEGAEDIQSSQLAGEEKEIILHIQPAGEGAKDIQSSQSA